MLDKIEFYYFSPTGGTKKAGQIFCEGFAKETVFRDLSVQGAEAAQTESEWIVVAAPVFGGRIPGVVTEKLKKRHGEGKKAVTLAVYGNRAYEDALLELNQTLEGQGFRVEASAALIAQHSMAPEVAKGRPDEQDRKEILDFAENVLDKIKEGSGTPVKAPGNIPYKAAMNMPAAPVSLPSCTGCGTCEKACPTGAIVMKDGTAAADLEKCILCMACTAACPEHARVLPPPLSERMEQMLGALKDVRRENEFFL